MSYAIAAAGTGGHVYPGLAVAEALVAEGIDRADIVFFGGDRLAADVVPAAGFPFVRLKLQGLRRSLSPDNLRLPAVVVAAARRMGNELTERRSSVLLAVGGYVTVSAALAARWVRVPFVIHEQNATPGLANRMSAPLARRVLVAFAPAAARLRRAEVVGNPLRPRFRDFDREALRSDALARYGLPRDAAVVGVLGGSLGARVLNDAAAALAAGRVPGRPAILHVAGPSAAAEMQRRAQGASVPWVVLSFEDSMEYFYAASDLVVGRAGALTVSELAATGTPSVLVPLTAVAQEGNAEVLVEAHGARIVSEDEVDSLERVVAELLADRNRLAEMSSGALRAARPDAAHRVAGVMLEVAGD